MKRLPHRPLGGLPSLIKSLPELTNDNCLNKNKLNNNNKKKMAWLVEKDFYLSKLRVKSNICLCLGLVGRSKNVCTTYPLGLNKCFFPIFCQY